MDAVTMAVAYATRSVVVMTAQLFVHVIKEILVGHLTNLVVTVVIVVTAYQSLSQLVGADHTTGSISLPYHQTLFIQDAKDTSPLPFNQLADDAVVKELDVCPGDAFRTVFFLFPLQHLLTTPVDNMCFKSKTGQGTSSMKSCCSFSLHC
jgi:hypothetical protein